MIHDDSPVHGYGHRDGAVHGGDQLVVGGLQQADVVHTVHSAAMDCKIVRSDITKRTEVTRSTETR